MSTTLDYFILLLPSFPPPWNFQKFCRWSDGDWNGQLLAEPYNWVRNKPPNISWALESCVIPILSGLAACLSSANARHHFKCHIVEKSLCHQERKGRETEERCLFFCIWNLALSAIWNLPPRLCLALAWRRQGCCVAQGGAKTNMGTKPNTWLQEMFWKL